MNFRSHGQFEVSIEGGVIISDVTGPFNAEIIREYASAMEEAIAVVASSGTATFAILATVRGASVFIPEAEQRFIELTKHRRERGLRAVAIIYDNVEAESLVRQQYERIYRASDVAYRDFASRHDARQWCESFLKSN
jgi:lysine/ornithine N-monooxygenase